MAKKVAKKVTKKVAKKATKKAPAHRRRSPEQMPKIVTPRINENFDVVLLPCQKVDLKDLAPDETGYEVNGYHAAVRFARGAGADTSMFGITCCAFARDINGRPYIDKMGLAIEGVSTASCAKDDLITKKGSTENTRALALDGALRDMLAKIAENAAFEQLGM